MTIAVFAALGLSQLAASGCGTSTDTATVTSATPTPQATMTGENFSTPVASSTSTPESSQQEIRVEASGFAKQAEGVGYGAVLANLSSQDALDVEVTVNLLDAKGNVIQTDTGTLTGIPAGKKFYYGGEMYVQKSDKPRKLEVYADAGSWDNVDLILPKVSNVRVFNEEYWGPKVTGQVTNNLDSTLSSIAKIGVVLFDKQGRVVGGGFAYLDADLRSGRKAGFESVNGPSNTPWSKVHQAAVSMENAVN